MLKVSSYEFSAWPALFFFIFPGVFYKMRWKFGSMTCRWQCRYVEVSDDDCSPVWPTQLSSARSYVIICISITVWWRNARRTLNITILYAVKYKDICTITHPSLVCARCNFNDIPTNKSSTYTITHIALEITNNPNKQIIVRILEKEKFKLLRSPRPLFVSVSSLQRLNQPKCGNNYWKPNF
jgi:hypothetical protein